MTDSPEFRRQQAEMQELRGFLENTMTEKKQPRALKIADDMAWAEGHTFVLAADELRRQHALIEELREALELVLDSLGALTKRHELLDRMSEESADAVFSALAKAEAQS